MVQKLAMVICVVALGAGAHAQEYVRYSAPELFTHEELVALSENVVEFPPELADKLHKITHTPFISNEAYYRGAKPHVPDIPGLGPSMRVVFWNIERGVNLHKSNLIFTDRESFLAEFRSKRDQMKARLEEQVRRLKEETGHTAPIRLPSFEELEKSLQIFRTADLAILNEVDLGMKRSNYREVAKIIGEVTDTNWAYGVEFVEVDPKAIGTATFADVEDPEERAALLEEYAVDKDRLRALHGTAIFSRYPIVKASVQPFKLVAYDWYTEELGLRPGEKFIRGATTFLGSPANRELRRGGRMFLTVELDVPHLPEGKLTVVSPHLENRTKPKLRRAQMEEVLATIKEIDHPVIVAGDFNTSGGDAQSYKFERNLWKMLKDYDFWVDKGFKYVTAAGLVYDLARFGVTLGLKQSDPTVRHVPYFMPNKERGLFKSVLDFRFADGGAFDFRGDSLRSGNGKGGTLGNSNERAWKGFEHTYEFVITIGGVGKLKLDWFLIKGYAEHPRDPSGSYRFAPHNGRTMRELNMALEEPLSDHYPMSVDLPFNEPPPPPDR